MKHGTRYYNFSSAEHGQSRCTFLSVQEGHPARGTCRVGALTNLPGHLTGPRPPTFQLVVSSCLIEPAALLQGSPWRSRRGRCAGLLHHLVFYSRSIIEHLPCASHSRLQGPHSDQNRPGPCLSDSCSLIGKTDTKKHQDSCTHKAAWS